MSIGDFLSRSGSSSMQVINTVIEHVIALHLTADPAFAKSVKVMVTKWN